MCPLASVEGISPVVLWEALRKLPPEREEWVSTEMLQGSKKDTVERDRIS